MIKVNIPNFKNITFKYLVLDYNGTLAFDGKLIKEAGKIINKLSKDIEVHIITANTFGLVKKELTGINCNLHIIPKDEQSSAKLNFIKKLGEEFVIAIGNGHNDNLMLKNAATGIAVIQKEGCSSKSLLSADLITNNIIDALNLISNPLRLIATLRS
jgi:soluble P-type ATPase